MANTSTLPALLAGCAEAVTAGARMGACVRGRRGGSARGRDGTPGEPPVFLSSFLLSSIELSDTKVYEP